MIEIVATCTSDPVGVMHQRFPIHHLAAPKCLARKHIMLAPNKNMLIPVKCPYLDTAILLLFAQIKVALEWYVPTKEMLEKALHCKFLQKDKE